MALFGMVGTGNWQNEARPESWRESLLYYWPNGMMPLTAMMSKIPSDPVKDPVHHWGVQAPPEQGGLLGDNPSYVYLDVDCQIPYQAGGQIGQPLYVSVPDAIADETREGHVVQLASTDYFLMTCNATVTGVIRVPGNSRIAIRLIEADDNGGAQTLADADYFFIVGTAHEEGSPSPDPMAAEPEWYENFTEIWWNTFMLTGTAEETRTRYGSKEYQRLKKHCLMLHGIEMEKSCWFGVKRVEKGANNQDKRYAMGIFEFTRTHAGAVYLSDFRRDPAFAGKRWVDRDGGSLWLKQQIELAYRYGDNTRVGFSGSGALMGLETMAEALGTINLSTGAKEYGIEVTTLKTANGAMPLKSHPLFSQHALLRNRIYFLGPKNVRFRPLGSRDTKFEKDPQFFDGKKEGYRTEGTFEFGNPKEFMVLEGVGCDNVLQAP